MMRMASSPRSSESGHLLLALMIGLTVMAIFLTVAAQQWSTVERREREKELIFRGNQYAKAIKKYQSEHGGAYPTTLNQLLEPGPRRLRYIRKLFRDPMAPDGKWGILLADPSGKGFINPNALPADTGGVGGLDDLGKGLDEKLQASNARNTGKLKLAAAKNGTLSSWDKSNWDKPAEDDKDSKNSVTAPGQPVGPIVGVVSLWDLTSFQRYHEHENYTEWTFSVFDLLENQQQQKNPSLPAAPTPNQGIGSGGQQTIIAPGGCAGNNCPPPPPPPQRPTGGGLH